MVKKILLLAFITVAQVGCDGNDNSGSSGAQKFLVRYEATGTFPAVCQIFYITRRDDVAPDEENEGGDALQTASTLPWNHSIEITVTKLRPFVTQVSAVCADSAEHRAEVVLFIDGQEQSRQEATGRNVAPMAEFRLEL